MEPLALVVGLLAMVAFIGLRKLLGVRGGMGSSTSTPQQPKTRRDKRRETHRSSRYPGDFTGRVIPEYSPLADGDADPGEIVWTWVPYEEDHARGKDRPVLLVGRDGDWLLGLQLSSQDHDRDVAEEARYGRRWMDIGSGPWDRKGRPSEVRLDRVLRVDPTTVRREGAILDRKLFTKVTDSL